MGKTLLKGCVLGGIITYIWYALSWMLLPWHCATLNQFPNESTVAVEIQRAAPKDGIYLIPNFCGVSKEELKEKKETIKNGPFVFMSVIKEGSPYNTTAPYIISFIIQLIGALFITILLLQTTGLAYWEKVGFVILVGLTVGFLGKLPFWNWWGFSFSFIIFEMIDLIIAWFLAGLAIAKIVKR